MREHKFRALYKPYNVMIDWNMVTALIDGKQVAVLKKESAFGEPGETVETGFVCGNPFFCIDLLMLYYIGLKDKKGKEIYEGDIVKINNKVLEVKWTEGWTGYSPFGFINRAEMQNIEVIGNVWENPELLKKDIS